MSPIHPLTVLALVALPGIASAQTPIRIGQTVTGRLTIPDLRFADSSRYKLYRFDGNRGDTVTADLVSDDFDANLVLADGSGNSLTRNDDGGENCNARLTTTFPQTGEYEIVVNSTGTKYATGRFSLSVTTGSKPKSVARCNRSE